MAETSGPRGPCTAPRRRCCPAWLWTATAWALLRPDACPLLACPARCRPGSTWLASISTRTRVSALRRGRPLLPTPTSRDLGEGGPGKTVRPVPWRSWDAARLFPWAGPRGCGQAQLPGRGDPRARDGGHSRGPGGEGCAARPLSPVRHALPKHTRLPKPEPPGAIPTPGPLLLQASLGFSKPGREKNKPAPHPLRRPSPELESFSWQTPLPGARGPF